MEPGPSITVCPLDTERHTPMDKSFGPNQQCMSSNENSTSQDPITCPVFLELNPEPYTAIWLQTVLKKNTEMVLITCPRTGTVGMATPHLGSHMPARASSKQFSTNPLRSASPGALHGLLHRAELTQER